MPQTNQPAQQSAGLNPTAQILTNAIGKQENGGGALNYSAKGKSGEYGAYQWIPDSWNAMSSKFGVNVPLEQATPEQQNQVAYSQVNDWLSKGYSPAQVASMWNAGEGAPNAYEGNSGTNSSGVHYDTQQYAANVQKYAEQLYNAQSGGVQAGTMAPADTSLPSYGATFPASPNDNLLVGGLKSLGNVPSSVWGLGAGILNTVTHPVQTLTNLGSAAIGGVENLTGQNAGGNPDSNQQMANNIGHAIMQRYGSWDAFKNTLTNDPAGAALDIASLVTGGEGLAAKGADLADMALGTDRAAVAADNFANAGKTGLNVMPQAGTYGSAVRSGISTMNDLALGTLGKIAAPITSIPGKIFDATVGGAKEDVLAAAQRTGVELPASATTNNSLIRSAEAIAATGAGETAFENRVNTAIEGMNNLAAKIVESTGGEADLQTVGKSIVKGAADMEAAHEKAMSAIYDGLEEKAGDVAAHTDTTVNLLHKLISGQESLGETANVGYFKNKLAVLNGAKVDEAAIKAAAEDGAPVANENKYNAPTYTTLKQLRTLVGKKIKNFNDPITASNKSDLIQMYASLSQDMRHTLLAQSGGEELAKAWDTANLSYADHMDEITSQYAKTIRRLADNGQEDKILNALFKPSMSANDIPRILEMAGEEGAKNIRAAFTQKLLDTAKDPVTGNFTAGKIEKTLAKYGDDKLNALLTPEQIQQMKDLGTLSDSMKEVLAFKRGASSNLLVRGALGLRSLGEPAALAYAGFKLLSGDIAGAAQLLGGVIGFEGASRFLASDIGNRALQWGAQHGSDFTKLAKKEGLTSETQTGTLNPNEHNPESDSGVPGGVSGNTTFDSISGLVGKVLHGSNGVVPITAAAIAGKNQ